jgi:phosphomevalonate kinase
VRRVLAISGKRFAGKDTLAASVVRQAWARGVLVMTHAFAGESKRMFAASVGARGVAVDELRLQGDRAYKEAWRPQLTEFTVAALGADPLVFCRAVADRIAGSECVGVVTDLRLRVEVAHLRSRFALYVVRVTRPDVLRAASGWRYTPAVDEHATETELDDPGLWDEEVHNDGTLAQLDEVVATRLSAWLG